jgi:hypothetical protein
MLSFNNQSKAQLRLDGFALIVRSNIKVPGSLPGPLDADNSKVL